MVRKRTQTQANAVGIGCGQTRTNEGGTRSATMIVSVFFKCGSPWVKTTTYPIFNRQDDGGDDSVNDYNYFSFLFSCFTDLNK